MREYRRHTVMNNWIDFFLKIVFLVSIDVSEGTAIFDFTGTGPEVWGNINAPKAVSHSALIYSLRCLVIAVQFHGIFYLHIRYKIFWNIFSMKLQVGEDIPLNQGCLNPVQIIIPKKSLLDPSEDAAVVGKFLIIGFFCEIDSMKLICNLGGNVLTSQRVVDVILRAFEACAASQGCCNNVTFGDDR